MLNKKRKIRERFKELRQLRGTQRFVAIELNVTETTIRHIECGHYSPSGKFMFKLAAYFNTTVYDLFPDIVEEARDELKELMISK